MAIAGVGTTLQYSTDGGTTWNSLAEVLNISGPGMTRDTIDTTALDTSGGYRTFIAGFKNPGTLTFNASFEKSQYNTLKTQFESDTLVKYKVTTPDNSTFEFDGLVTEMPLTIPPDDKITMDVTIQISGQVTFTAGS